MEIAFITEMTKKGKLPKDFKDMRTLESWMYSFDATNIPITNLKKEDFSPYDLIIAVIPKKDTKMVRNIYDNVPLNKTAILQEGPCYYFQELEYNILVYYEALLRDCKMILCHNQRDVNYFKMFNKECLKIPTCTDTKMDFGKSKRGYDAMMFGTFCKWYNGITSYNILKDTSYQIWMPMMGRFSQNDIEITKEKGIKVLQYMSWDKFMQNLNKADIACHMMPTMAASSYAINCAMLGIPCICSPSDVSRDLFPYTTCSDPYDYVMGSVLANRLINDQSFKDKVIEHALLNVGKYDYRKVCSDMKKEFKEVLKK